MLGGCRTGRAARIDRGGHRGGPIDPGSIPQGHQGRAIELRSTREGQRGGKNGPSRPIWVDLGGFGSILVDFCSILVDFCSILVPKWQPKRFHRHALRRLLFDGVFDDGLVNFSSFFVELAFGQPSRKVVFHLTKT